MTRRFLALLGAAALLGAGPAPAANGDWDADADGMIDREEFDAGYDRTGLFQRFDTDGDGSLDGRELAGVRYASMDVDGDGRVSADEWGTWIERRAGGAAVDRSPGEWDANADGIISRAEYDAEVARRGMFENVAGGDDAAFDEDEFRTGLFDDLDLDGDQRLDADEFPAGGFGL